MALCKCVERLYVWLCGWLGEVDWVGGDMPPTALETILMQFGWFGGSLGGETPPRGDGGCEK
jgi:hypothetical protein